MRASPDALRQCTRHRPMSMHFMPVLWHYISGQFSIQAPRKPQKSAIFLPQPPPKLFKFSLAALLNSCPADEPKLEQMTGGLDELMWRIVRDRNSRKKSSSANGPH